MLWVWGYNIELENLNMLIRDRFAIGCLLFFISVLLLLFLGFVLFLFLFYFSFKF